MPPLTCLKALLTRSVFGYSSEEDHFVSALRQGAVAGAIWRKRPDNRQHGRRNANRQPSIFAPVQTIDQMRDFFFAFGHICQTSFDWLLVSVGWFPPVVFTIVLAFGAVYWMMAQAKYSRRAIERKEYI